MKLFNIENGKEKVYVQYQDLMEIINGEMGNNGFPASLMDKLFASGQPLFVSDHNRWDFVEFDKPADIEYFRSQKWILDIKEYRGLSFEGMQAKSGELVDKHNALCVELKDLSEEELDGRKEDVADVIAYRNIYHTLPELSHVLRGLKKMNFPVVVDSDGYDCGSNDEYEAKSSLDPNKIIIRRKDGQPLNKGKVSRKFIKEVIANGAVGMSEARATFCTVGNAKYSISEDGMYIVLTYKVEPILMKEEVEFKKNNTFVKRMKRKLAGQPEIME